MNTAVTSIIIVAIAIVLYVTEKIPLSVTTIFAMLAMAITGVLTYEEAFSGFAASATLTTAGLMIIGEAFTETGLAQAIGKFLTSHLRAKKKWLVVLFFLAAGFMSIFFTSTTVLLLMMPIVDSMARESKGEAIRRKDAYYPIAVAGILSSNMSIIGSISMMTSIGLLENSSLWHGGDVAFLAPLPVGAPAYIACLLVYMTFGYRMQDKIFDFPDVLPDYVEKEEVNERRSKKKMIFTAVVFCCCLVFFYIGVIDIAAVALAGATILILAKCLDEKTVFRKIDWNTIIIVGGAIGFAKGLEVGGGAQLAANVLLDLVGTISTTPFAMCLTMLIISTLISNFCSNTAAAVMLVPISLMMAQNFSYDPFPFVMAVAVGVNLSVSTPICVSTITMTLTAGYRAKDYLRMGGFLNILSVIVTAVALHVLYF